MRAKVSPPLTHANFAALRLGQLKSSAAKVRSMQRRRVWYMVALVALASVYWFFFHGETIVFLQSVPEALNSLSSIGKLFSVSSRAGLSLNGSAAASSAHSQGATIPTTTAVVPTPKGNKLETVAHKQERLVEHLYLTFPYVPGRLLTYTELPNKDKWDSDKEDGEDSSDSEGAKKKEKAGQAHFEFIIPDLSRATTNFKNRLVPLTTQGAVRGVVFLAHTCKMRPHVWWPRDADTCPGCTGMPVERELVRRLVFRGYLPVSMAPLAAKKSSQCWTDVDKDAVLQVVGHVYRTLQLNATIAEQHRLGASLSGYSGMPHSHSHSHSTDADLLDLGTPLYALGIANGAIFIERLAATPASLRGFWNISAAVLMNGGIWRPVEERARLYPPLLFQCMARNSELCVHNNLTATKLTSLGGIASQQSFEPRPVYPSFFHDNGRVLSRADSERLYRALDRAQLLWPGSGIFIDDPLFGSSRDSVKRIVHQTIPHIVPAVDSFKFPGSPLAQLLSLAWGFKETTEEGADGIADWFDQFRPM